MLGKITGNVLESAQRVGSLIMPNGWPEHLRPKPVKHLSKIFHGFNFILLHYIYLIFMALFGGCIIYAIGGLDFIDALFFATGSATQSGLNTVDLNKIYLSQQIIFVLMSCLCNPIIINTFVVFVRLYWFEKRFQGVVQHARTMRGRTIPRRRSEDGFSTAVDRVEHGFGGRDDGAMQVAGIDRAARDKETVLGHDSDNTSPDIAPDEKKERDGSIIDGMAKTSTNNSTISPTTSRPFHRDIMFADEVVSPPKNDAHIPNEDRVPEQRSKEQHIAFVESQRKMSEAPTLFIPGPRDVERGAKPQRIDDDESSDTDPLDTSGGPLRRQDTEVEPMTGEDGAPKPFAQRIKYALGRIREGDEDEVSPGLRDRFKSRTQSFQGALSKDRHDINPLPYLSYAATIGRNSTFVDLTEEQREELGGIEYRALKTLTWVLLGYYLGTFAVSFIIMVPWITQTKTYANVVTDIGQSPTWWGFFTTMSLFTDLGFTLTPDSMISFQLAALPLLLGIFLIIAGNTGFPCFLRFIIWVASKCVPYGSGVWEELRFLLDHPRRCFTLLFPRKATWWLFGILVALNGVDLIFFFILDLHDETVLAIPGGFRFLVGLFQAASTRTAGFSAVNLANLHPGIQVSYMVMMYISIFPIAISVRNTNVYEEKSLGVYGRVEENGDADPEKTSYLGNHLRRQLSFDLWYVFLGLFLITIIEGRRIENVNEPAFTIFSVLFEIVSAYGTVGLSLGYPTINASFSAEFKTLSKLIIIAMMIRGRHRGLPYALDRAILLPSESLQRKEQAMDEARRERRASMASVLPHLMGADSHNGPRLGEISTKTNMSRTSVRDRSRHGLKRVLTGALSPGTTLKHHHH